MAYSTDRLASRSERRMVDFDPDATTLTLVDLDPASNAECLPLLHFRRFMAGLFRSVGTGVLTAWQIIAATDADGGGATVVVAGAVLTPDAVGDRVWLECDIEQVRLALPTATHIGVRVQYATATDEGVVFFERADPEFPRAGLTADYVS